MNFQVGVNLGGWISQYPAFDTHHFDTFITKSDIEQIASWGMDHVRLPVDYPVLESDDKPFAYRAEGFAYIDRCLEWCQARGLGVVLDLHKAPGFAFDKAPGSASELAASLFNDPVKQERLIGLWEALAGHYLHVRDTLAFELLNEIVLPTSEPWNQLASRLIHAIRTIDPGRLIVVGGNQFNAASQLSNLHLPDDPCLLYTFHFYAPMMFTHQKAPWVPLTLEYNQTVEYPGECPGLLEFLETRGYHTSDIPFLIEPRVDRDAMLAALQPALDFMERTGRPLYCGEYGVIDRAPAESSARWHRDFVGLLREHGIGRAVWSYKQMDFGLVDANGRVVNPELVKIVSER